MSKQTMLEARELIRQERYDEARAILRTINHPVAEKWLAKLDEIAPEHAPEVISNREPSKSRLPIFAVLSVIIGLLAGAAVVWTQTGGKSDTDSFTTLATYFPADTAMYASIRTDNGHIAALDTILAKLGAQTTTSGFGALMPGASLSLSSMLDMVSQQNFGGDFETTIRPWLGNSIAIGGSVSSANGADSSGLMVIRITDREKATAFIINLLAKDLRVAYIRREISGYTLFTPEGGSYGGVYAIGDDVIFVASRQLDIPLMGLPEASLMGDADFRETMAMLQASSYNALFYMNVSSFVSSVNTSSGQSQAITDAVRATNGQQAWGLTILDDRSLVLDMVGNVGDLTPLRNLGFTLTGTGPIDRDFLANVPVDADIVVQGTDFKSLYDLYINVSHTNDLLLGQTTNEMDAKIAEAELLLTGFTDLNLQDDILSWLTGDFAVFANYDVPAAGTPSLLASAFFPDQQFNLDVQAGVIIEATDPAKAQHVIDALESFLPVVGSVTHEQIGGTDALVAAITQASLSSPVEMVIAQNNALFVVGTREAATAVLTGQGGFNGAPRYTQAQVYHLGDHTSVWYLGTDGINLYQDAILGATPLMNAAFVDIVLQLSETPNDEAERQRQLEEMLERQRALLPTQQQAIREAAALFDSITMSTEGTADGDTIVRLVMTFAE